MNEISFSLTITSSNGETNTTTGNIEVSDSVLNRFFAMSDDAVLDMIFDEGWYTLEDDDTIVLDYAKY